MTGVATGSATICAKSIGTPGVQSCVQVSVTAPSTILFTSDKDTPGTLEIENTYAGWSHSVTNADDAKQVADINGAAPKAELPPGIYNVQVANGVWRGVEVKPGETTVLKLGQLAIDGGQNDIAGYTLLDPETGNVVLDRGVISTIPLLPTIVTLSSGHLTWPDIEIKAGETVTIHPARITVRGEKAGEYKVTTKDGKEAGSASRLFNLPLPPGDYIAHVEGQTMEVHLEEGQTHEIVVE